jgi:hypothetical protein
MQPGIAICSRASPAPSAPPVVLAFSHKVVGRVEYVLAWPCPYCGAGEHRHVSRGRQASACGRGVYHVRWSGGRIAV